MGLSLIELVISIFIIGISISSIIALIIIGVEKNRTADDYFKAQLLAFSRIEHLKSISSDSALTFNNSVEPYNSIPDYFRFKRITYTQPVTIGDSSLLKIESNVFCKTQNGEIKLKLCGVFDY